MISKFEMPKIRSCQILRIKKSWSCQNLRTPKIWSCQKLRCIKIWWCQNLRSPKIWSCQKWEPKILKSFDVDAIMISWKNFLLLCSFPPKIPEWVLKFYKMRFYFFMFFRWWCYHSLAAMISKHGLPKIRRNHCSMIIKSWSCQNLRTPKIWSCPILRIMNFCSCQILRIKKSWSCQMLRIKKPWQPPRTTTKSTILAHQPSSQLTRRARPTTDLNSPRKLFPHPW